MNRGATRRSREPDNSPESAQRGQALILFVIGLGVLMGMVAMAVDVGMILHERRSLQNAADAAAIAGTWELPEDAILADAKAQEWAELNGIDLNEGDVLQITVSPDNTEVTVRVEREVSFIFGRVLGLDVTTVSADATARVGSPAALSGILPFGLLENVINYDGNPITIKYDATDPTNGNFGPISPDGPGASTHEDAIINGSYNSVCARSQPSCQDPTVGVQTGNMIGATRDGFNYRFDNTSTACDEFDEVLFFDPVTNAYKIHGTCNPFIGATDSYLLVLVPVIDRFPTGSSTDVNVLYFTALFLNSFDEQMCIGNSCEVTGTLVKIVADPTNDATLGTYDPTSGIRLVRLVE